MENRSIKVKEIQLKCLGNKNKNLIVTSFEKNKNVEKDCIKK